MSIVLSFTFMMSCSNDDEVVVPNEVPQEVDTPLIDSLKVKILQPPMSSHTTTPTPARLS